MAFGFGFNKQKLLSAAEKFVQQGKLQNAIAEYEKILKNDPKDLTVANTVGDLYARLGENDRAIECFKNVGDAYATQGFTVKAIAMYKKISKIKSSLEGILKLAELYTQQGLFNDARAQYLQVAEEFLRAGELEQAVRIFQKILEMDPENVAMRARLAEVYIRLGKKTEAWQIFSTAAESLRARGSLSAAEEILQRMLSLDPGNSYALLLRGRNALESGDYESGIKYLEKVADLDSHPDGLRDLLKAYLQTGRLADAGTLASKLLTVHNDVDGIWSLSEALMQSGQYQEALHVYCEHAERLIAANSAKVQENLHSMIGHLRESPQALNSLLELLHKAGDTTHIGEVNELLAHAYVQSGDLAGARDLYQKLAAMEPQNALHMKNYEQVVAMMGGTTGSRLITAEEGAVMVDELEATAPMIDQHYPDAVALAVRSALTDADLFASYNMPGKALVPLLAALPKAPRDLRLNQRLAALHTRAERFAEAAVCCRTLESVYSEAGYPEEATRYGELASKYEERSSAAAQAAPEEAGARAATAAEEMESPKPERREFTVHETAPESAAEFAVQETPPAEAAEFDLSDEWEGSFSGEAGPGADAEAGSAPQASAAVHSKPAAPADSAAVAETIEEIRFYLGHYMADQARSAMAKLEKLTPNPALLANIRAEIAAAEAEVRASKEAEEVEPEVVEEVEAAPEPARPAAKAAGLDEFVADLESSLGESFLTEAAQAAEIPAEPEPSPDPEPVAAEAEYALHGESKTGTLGEFVSDLESSLGEDFLRQAPAAQPEAQVEKEPEPVVAKARAGIAASAAGAAAAPALAPIPAVAAAATAPVASGSPTLSYKPSKMRQLSPAGGKFSAAGVDLAEMFGELKQELEEEVNTAEEDPETHYNLGVAFREMGLLDEAIGELQKVCQAVEKGHPFAHVMQTYTWLAQCFLDKGVPEAAIRWYERALKLPSLDEDTRIALHYELASAYETAQDKPAALHHFMEVYGSNIDYRDVAERIKALKS